MFYSCQFVSFVSSVVNFLSVVCFFVSVERIKDPSLKGKPVVVGGSPNGRGVVASASYEARKFGVRSAMPASQALRLYPKLIMVRGSHREYSEYSDKIYDRLRELVPIVERVSIDEMYLDLTGCGKLYSGLFRFIADIQAMIDKEIGLPCSIALASNRTVAKIATDTVKPHGLCQIQHGKEKEFLAPLPISAIPGVGKQSEQRLKKEGFHIIADIQAIPSAELEQRFGKHGSWLYRVANGKGRDILLGDHVRKSIGQEQTLSSNVSDKSSLRRILHKEVESVCSTLRKKNWKTRTITVKIRYSNFETITRSKTISPTNHDPEIFAVAKELLDIHYDHNRSVRLVGVQLTNFVDADDGSLLLFPDPDKKRDLHVAVDALRKKFGRKIIHIGKSDD